MVVKMGKIIALVNQKGGVGKTTSSINLAASLGYLGKRVLLIDLDPQGNSTTGLGIDKGEIKKSIYDLLIGEAELKDVIKKTKFKNLFIIPATLKSNTSSTTFSMISFGTSSVPKVSILTDTGSGTPIA